MATSKPLWRRGVEAVDRVAAPVLEGAVKHDAFSLGLSVLGRTRRAVHRRTERMSRRLLHRLNLPTATDVNRLLVQIAAVENRQRIMSAQLEERLPARNDRTAPPSRSAGATP